MRGKTCDSITARVQRAPPGMITRGSPRFVPISWPRCSRNVPQSHRAYSAPGQSNSYFTPSTSWSQKGGRSHKFLLMHWPGRSSSNSTSRPVSSKVSGGGGRCFPSTFFRPSAVCWKSIKPEGPHASADKLQRKMQGLLLPSSSRWTIARNPSGSVRETVTLLGTISMRRTGVFELGALVST